MGFRSKQQPSSSEVLIPEVLHLEYFEPVSEARYREMQHTTPKLASKLLEMGLVKPPMDPTFTGESRAASAN